MDFLDTNTDMSNFQDVSGSGGISIFKHLGNSSGNITLEKNKITTVHITGNHTITLPAVSTTKQEVCILDFTTYNASYPTITNTNIKKKNGLALTPSATTATAKSITGATNASPIEITSASHGCETGDVVTIASVGGNTAANGTWIVTKTGTNTFTLDGSTGNSNYTSGGTATRYISRNRLIAESILGKDMWEVRLEQFGGVSTSFTQPNLSANGILGGASFAVATNHQASGYELYKAFDGNSGTEYHNGGVIPTYITMYNPQAIKSNYITYTVGDRAIYALTWYGSNDNSNWATLGTFSGSWAPTTTHQLTIDSSVQNFYKYYKIECTAADGNYVAVKQITINGTYILT